MSKDKHVKIDPSLNRSLYDSWSTFYDRYPNPTVYADEQGFPAFWAHLRGKRVLEIGCGTGRHTEKLVALGNDVTGLDLSPGMLAVAKAKPSLAGVQFVEGNVFEFEPPSGVRYDAVLAALVLEHIDAIQTFFTKVSALLDARGEAFFSEIHPVRAHDGRLAHFKNQDGSGESHLASIAHSEDELRAAIATSGLTLVRCADVVGPESMPAVNSAWAKHVGRPMVQIWHLRR